jgi:hypothetical protein
MTLSSARLLVVLPLALAAWTVTACGDDAKPASDTGATADVGQQDAGQSDTGVTDTGATDLGATDPGATDPGAADPGATVDTAAADPGATVDTATTDTAATDTAATDAATTDTAATDTAMTDTPLLGCAHNEFTAVAQDAGDYLGIFRYLAQSTLGAPVDLMTFEFIPGVAGVATGVGQYILTDDNYADCANCLTMSYQCDENLSNCAQAFLVQSGTLDITTWDAAGGTFAGTLSDAIFAEATFDGQLNSTVVPGGDAWCIQSYSFSATIQ